MGWPSTATMTSVVGFEPGLLGRALRRDRGSTRTPRTVPVRSRLAADAQPGRGRDRRPAPACLRRNDRMAVTGAPSTTGVQAAAFGGRPEARCPTPPTASSGRGRRRGALAGPHQDARPRRRVESSSGRARDGRALQVDVEHLQQRLRRRGRARRPAPSRRPRRGRGARPVRGQHRAERRPGRVGLARAQPIRPLAGDCGTSSARSESLSLCPTLA